MRAYAQGWALHFFGPSTRLKAAQFAMMMLTAIAMAIALCGRYIVNSANQPSEETQRQLRARPHANALRQLIQEAEVGRICVCV